jgi:Gpi18-like mannosyltransferase
LFLAAPFAALFPDSFFAVKARFGVVFALIHRVAHNLVRRVVRCRRLTTAVVPNMGSKPVEGGMSESLSGSWQRCETTHYLHLAREGYCLDEPGFSIRPPLYRVLICWLGALLKGDHQYLIGALLISNTAAPGYFLVFVAPARDALDPEEGGRTLLHLNAYPWAFFLLAGYAESLLPLPTTLTFWASLRRRGWLAGTCGALTALTCVQGAVLELPLLLETLRQRRFRIWSLPLEVQWCLLPEMAAVAFVLCDQWWVLDLCRQSG